MMQALQKMGKNWAKMLPKASTRRNAVKMLTKVPIPHIQGRTQTRKNNVKRMLPIVPMNLIQQTQIPAPSVYCQCRDENTQRGCKQVAMKNSLFCEKHQGCPGSPTSGYEPSFEPLRYNCDKTVYGSHNCYSYSMNVLDKQLVKLCKKTGKCRQYFHQPGALRGDRFALNSTERRACPVVDRLMKTDVPEIENSTYYTQCPTGKSKIALVVDPGEDYHYYRQDSDGWWSHKDGSNPVKRFDALKRPIFNPEYAARDYRWQGSDLNYEDFCGYYCVPRSTKVVLGRGGTRKRKHTKP